MIYIQAMKKQTEQEKIGKLNAQYLRHQQRSQFPYEISLDEVKEIVKLSGGDRVLSDNPLPSTLQLLYKLSPESALQHLKKQNPRLFRI